MTRRRVGFAGTPDFDQTADVPGPLIADCMGSDARLDRLDDALADVLSTLARLNRELNGPVPSASTDGADQISRLLDYAIAEIVRMLREDSTLLQVVLWST